jgi:SNF2 family DNA or RNA helicase
MGQTRTVQIRRYIVRDSVEERMLLLQDKKRSMVEDALGSSGTENQSSRLADLLLLFSLDAGGATGSRSKRL